MKIYCYEYIGFLLIQLRFDVKSLYVIRILENLLKTKVGTYQLAHLTLYFERD
jgi:hypothetical protein